ncbi:helix-turn-helix transcriptional regulator [Methyloterricola oryzae]|uniref:helix-turn-helix transcriptional regulator n=1 Tax=Methyloterricola oryzae TaxID=1495050 RepID=UPI0005EBB17B|nr:helix-turn-helix transcriptional regulator [Methyloterricola oryzae]
MGKNGADEFETLLGELYDCAVGTGDWSALVAGIAGFLRSDMCNLFSPPSGAGDLIWHAHRVEQQAWQDYVAYYAGCDILAQLAFERGVCGVGDVFSDEYLIAKRDLVRTEFYRDFWTPLNIHSSLSTLVCAPDAGGLPMVVLSLYRPPDQPGFTTEEFDRISRLLPHLQRAFRLLRRTSELQAKAHMGLQVIETLSLPLLIVDPQGRLVHMNGEAERLLAGKTLGLAVKGGRLQALNVADKDKLARLLMAASGRPALSGGMMLTPSAGSARWHAFVSPLPAASARVGERQSPLALIMLIQTDRPPARLKMMGEIYKLSPAELRLAEALVAGKTIEEHAESAQISINTVKTQLRSLFSKTGTKRQGELIALLSRAPPLAPGVDEGA